MPAKLLSALFLGSVRMAGLPALLVAEIFHRSPG